MRASSLATRVAAMLSLSLVVTSCATAPVAEAARLRPVRPGPQGPQQWTHEWSRGAVFYQIFVRSFQDSNGDGIGDINGLISRLDYLNDGDPATTTDLGIEGIWLMPMFESPSYHGYDTVDYDTIERDYGTNEDFARLIEEAHARGIRIIVDLVVNHSSSQHPWFVDSASSVTSAKRDWYVWSATNPGWVQPWGGNSGTWHEKNGAFYYGVFWGGMPDLNYKSAEVRAEMNRIAGKWLRAGLDGYRLDATRYLVETGGGRGQSDTSETHAALKELSSVVRSVKPDATLVAENWTETPIIATYFGSTSEIAWGDEMPMNFNFPLASAIISSVQSGNGATITKKLVEVGQLYPRGVNDAPFLTNHDQVRIATVVGNDQGQLRNAAAILLTLPGAPFIYYGEELGLLNGPTSGDESKRTPMPWDATGGGGFTTGTPWFQFAPGKETTNVARQTNEASSLLSRYRELIGARKASVALRKGTITPLNTTAAGASYVAWTSTSEGETVLVVHNVTGNFIVTGPLNVPGTTMEKVWSDANTSTPSKGQTGWTVSLPPRSSGVWRVK
ncbi:MAG: alpha-amylase family glycosyl hydrolase [Thermoanaerobaculia bacterium]|nr:alpha-amylase family glycosyl hydrolase [Thermoanaerobaculia bacterium]